MSHHDRPPSFWFFEGFLALSIVLMLLGQTMSVFNYDLTVRLGLQESLDQVGAYGVQVNRAFGVGDTVVYIPLMMASLVGLWMRRRWSVLTTAACVGISAYWAVTAGCILLFAPDSPEYRYVPGLEIWSYIGAYVLFGVWGLVFLIKRGETLIQ